MARHHITQTKTQHQKGSDPTKREYQKQQQQRKQRSGEEIQTLLVASTLVDGVALGALGLEDLLAGLRIARRGLRERRHIKDQDLGLGFHFLNDLSSLIWRLSDLYEDTGHMLVYI